MAVDQARLEELGRELLLALGEDPQRPGLRDTPRRWARWWSEFIDRADANDATAFAHQSTGDLVVVSGIRAWSICEHHLLPFSVNVAIGYLPAGQLLGLSKFGRITHQVASRLQVQEHLVAEIADRVEKVTAASDVAVLAAGEHLCMVMRGVRTPATMTSSVMRGRFYSEPELRAEFLHIATPSGRA